MADPNPTTAPLSRTEEGMPMVLRGAKLHATLNREYSSGFRDGARGAALITAAMMAILALLIFGGGWLIWRFVTNG